MINALEQIPFVRYKLNLVNPPFNEIPDDFILLLFTSKTRVLTRHQKYTEQQYGYHNYENFEFIGDTILDYLIVRILMESDLIRSPGQATYLKQLLTQNSTLGTLMKYSEVCQFRILGDPQYERSKTELNKCADLFEGILGGVFWYLEYFLKIPNAMFIIQKWLIETWSLNQILADIIQTGKLIIPDSFQQAHFVENPESFKQTQTEQHVEDFSEEGKISDFLLAYMNTPKTVTSKKEHQLKEQQEQRRKQHERRMNKQALEDIYEEYDEIIDY